MTEQRDRRDHPFPEGARVWHRGQQWASWIADRGTATVLEAKPQPDGTYEYHVQVDDGISWPTAGGDTWWASYATNRALDDLFRCAECGHQHFGSPCHRSDCGCLVFVPRP